MEDVIVIIVNDKNFFGVGVGVEGQVGDYFLVGEFIVFGSLDDIVEDENVVVVGGFEEKYILVFVFFVVQDFVDFEGYGLVWRRVR